MNIVLFNQLWTNHPAGDFPCDEETFPNQCAIRMGVALEQSGVNTHTFDKMYPNRRCYPGFKHSPRHILAAQELANWIKSETTLFGDVEIHKKVTKKEFMGKKGIIFIKDGWGIVDHIDVWNGVEMKGGRTNYFARGKEVWLWGVKK
ncbi:MAG: hypothetical protein GY820_23500 [Gammaproteobacteria bacterium]|nr:hypothetical protein [Gammaproteobacteria bacterium]